MQTLLSPVTRAAYFTAAPPTAVTTRPLAYHVPLRSISDRHVPSLTLSSSFSSSYAAPTQRGPKLSIGTIRASSPPISQNFTSPNDETEKAKLLQAPPRADVIKSLKNGIVLNILGMGAAVLGMQATVGLLVAKALTSSANPYQGLTPGYSPVLALDVFLVQASANTILSHFLGLLFSLELLRSVTLPPSEGIPIPRFA
ncbi:protein TIC 21 [Pyrus ussuriensis x Pyrus communis]|uniref:Protein TIC 21 n=1 Tax=Pyrus ussuriensis x Pyrus communis TaxID=2448454 RepID=A0A5N5FI79_9ROSA|nr:protein TIC 21 [Pyrus ussuriensis x Pyrus communis]